MIKQVMQSVSRKDIASLEDVLEADREAREKAHDWLASLV
jgi:1-deoxy-D-xylulose-5-phosphate reductoisomerase